MKNPVAKYLHKSCTAKIEPNKRDKLLSSRVASEATEDAFYSSASRRKEDIVEDILDTAACDCYASTECTDEAGCSDILCSNIGV